MLTIPNAYASYPLTPEQRRYCTTHLELLAIVRLTRQFRHHLLGKPFTIRTDHNSLTWLLRFKKPQGQLARWIEELSQYNMVLKHRKGRLHAMQMDYRELVGYGAAIMFMELNSRIFPVEGALIAREPILSGPVLLRI